MPFGDLKFHDHSYIFFLDVNQNILGTSSMANPHNLEEQGTTSWSMM
jgi:hypothetical protein